MLSFHNDPAIKKKYIKRVKAHYKADEIEHGYYWENGKGCAVGCTIHGEDHSKYEDKLGIPIILARLEDRIFENLPTDHAKKWPIKFLESIKVGVDLSEIWPKFAEWLLINKDYGVINYTDKKEIKSIIEKVAECYGHYKTTTKEEWLAVRRNVAAAYAAYTDADADAAAAAADAVYAAYAAAAADAAAAAYAADAVYAAYAAAAADAAAAYAADAVYAAYAAAAAADAVYAARQKHVVAQADKLLELLRSTG